MARFSFSARYAAAMAECGGRCPIEAGVIRRLADHECRHGRLPPRPDPAVRVLARGGRRGARVIAPGRAAAGRAPRRVNNPAKPTLQK
jgi:hypothetical protein